MEDSLDKRYTIDDLLSIMARLRGKNGCPWDREQTQTSLRQYLLEECYETLDAMESGQPEKHAEELGDLLLQIVFQARIAQEQKQFNFADVVHRLCTKLIRRHPHVFGSTTASGTAAVLKNWEAIKAREKNSGQPHAVPASLTDGVPHSAPALQRAHHLQKKMSRVGFDWSAEGDVVAKIDEELAELKQALTAQQPEDIKEELGDLLFAVVNLSRFRGLNAEEALRAATEKCASRVRAVEERVRGTGRELSACTPQELDDHWNAVKQ